MIEIKDKVMAHAHIFLFETKTNMRFDCFLATMNSPCQVYVDIVKNGRCQLLTHQAKVLL
jgi:hypothetical protein